MKVLGCRRCHDTDHAASLEDRHPANYDVEVLAVGAVQADGPFLGLIGRQVRERRRHLVELHAQQRGELPALGFGRRPAADLLGAGVPVHDSAVGICDDRGHDGRSVGPRRVSDRLRF